MFTDPTSMLTAPASYGDTVRRAAGLVIVLLIALFLAGSLGSTEVHQTTSFVTER